MKIYLLDDDEEVTAILKMIIEDKDLGIVCGIAHSPSDALDDLRTIHPDIAIVDLLMPEMDGISFVKEVRAKQPGIAFIMLSQVSSKDMVAKAYESGIQFFLQKPLNSVEIMHVMRSVEQAVSMNRTLSKVKGLIDTQTNIENDQEQLPEDKSHIQTTEMILQRIGIMGEIGSKDIIALVDYLVKSGEHVGDSTLSELCGQISDTPKSVEQRIRRAAIAGMQNLANMGIEDYYNDVFIEYASSLYNFEQVRKEMNYIRGTGTEHGNVKIRNFLNSLVAFCKNRNL